MRTVAGGGGAMPDIENTGVLILWGYNPSNTRLTHATAVVKALTEQFIPVKVNASRDPALAQALDITSFPTLVYAAPNGKILGQQDGYLDATIQESLRRRPVLGNAAPRFARQPVDVGDWHYPEGVCLVANAYLLHHDPAIYPDPYAFRPERFLEEPPGTYTWIPFGGGRRRCLGASFAQLEMRIVLRAVLSRHDVIPAARAAEPTRRRSITFSPGDGALAVLSARTREPVAA